MRNILFLGIFLIGSAFGQKDTLKLVNQAPPYVWVQRDVFAVIEDVLLRDSLKAQNDTIAPTMMIHATDTINTEWPYYEHPFDTNWSITDTIPAYWAIGYLDTAFLSNPPPQGAIVIDTSAIVFAEFAIQDTVWYRTWFVFDVILWYEEPAKPNYLVGIQSNAFWTWTWQEIPYKPDSLIITR